MKTVSFFSVFLLTACVTINIYFPAVAAEQVADEIIKGIQTEETNGLDAEDNLLPQSKADSIVYQLLVDTAGFLIPSAQATNVDFAVNTVEIRQLRARMKSRYGALKSFYNKGMVGIKTDGLLVSRGSIPLKDRNKVTKLVAAENSDRQQLYQAIANANSHPEWYAQIKSTFSTRWLSNAKSGWWYQTSNGNWKQK